MTDQASGSPDRTAEHHPEKRPNEARQGRRVLGMPAVLGISTLVAAALLFLIMIAWVVGV